MAFALFFLAQWLIPEKSFAQCVDGSNPTPVLIDTTIKFKTGATTTVVKFPQFDPENGMLRCVKLTVTMIGVVDTVSMQNLSSETQTASFDYVRNDQMTGPGLTTALTNNYSKCYGLYPNPSAGMAGIKLVNVRPGKLLVQVSNAQGQQVLIKEATVASKDYIPLAPLSGGVYWVKITDATTRTSCVKQLVAQ